MGNVERNGQELSACQQYQTLLAVSEAIVSHRDLATLFHDLAGRLHLVVRFDYLACVLHDATSNAMRLHILKATEPIPAQAPRLCQREAISPACGIRGDRDAGRECRRR